MFFSGAFLAAPAAAEIVDSCGPRDEILEKAERQYGERPVVRAITAEGGMVEILASADGSFTVIITGPGKPPLRSCIGMTGTGMFAVAPEWGLEL